MFMKNNFSLKMVLMIIFLLLFSTSCSPNNELVGSDPEGIPPVQFNDVVQIFLPEYLNERTGCYTPFDVRDRYAENKNYVLVNEFRAKEKTAVGFFLIIKSGHRFIFSGKEGLVLYRFDEVNGSWEEIAFVIAPGSELWVNGDVLTLGYYLDFGRNRCHFLPDEPVFIEFMNEDDAIAGKYRLYTWGFELAPNENRVIAFVGDYVEFMLD
jgi:hypothetical protein